MSNPGAVITTRASLAVLGVLALALGGCDGDSDATREGHLDGLVPLVAEEDVRIGDVDDPDVGFSQVMGVDVDDEGLVYVLEGSVPEIRVYDLDGRVRRRIGRGGGGPGEFEGFPRFGVVGDTVWTWDSSINRITLFDREGGVLSTGRTDGITVPLPASFGHVLPWRMRPDGKFTSHMSRVAYSRDDPPTGVRPSDDIPVPFVLFDALGEVTDTIGWAGRPPPRMWRPPSEGAGEPQYIQAGERRMMVPRPPTPLPYWEALADGYLLIETPLADSPDEGTFTVTRFGLAGDTVFSRAVRYRPVPYTEEELDSVAARAVRGGPGGGVPYVPGREATPPNAEGLARRLRNAMDFPAFHLPLQSTWLSQDETLWLRLREGLEPTVRWVLLDAVGRPRGRLELPAELRILWNRGDTFWAVEPDELEVPWVVRYRIREG